MSTAPRPRANALRPKDSRTSLPVLTRQTLLRARVAARETGRTVLDELEIMTKASPRGLLRVLAREFGLAVIESAEMLATPPALDRLPLTRAMQRQCALLQPEGGAPAIGVMPDPFDTDLLTWLESQARGPIEVRLALASDIQAFLGKLEETVRATDSVVQDDSARRDGRSAAVLSFVSVSESASPAVKVVNSTLYDALKTRASDIHLESTSNGLAVKYRIDGVLDHGASLNGVELAEQVISRLKVLAELDIAERRVPQDGSFRVEAGGREIDLRVSIMPSIHGEDAVIRILDKRAMMAAHGALRLESLGYDETSLRTLRELVEEPHGMLLVTGPTGSGKTTTLYAALTEIHNGRDKIITIEDPVEYQLPGILQIPVNERKGLTFAKGLRSILRHDPDKIMVGEIRDRETAEIAVQSALTGHLVLSTVHANNVFDVFGRFTHMGVDAYAFVSALNGIWAQRLVRLGCTHCAAPFVPADAELARLGLARRDVAGWQLRRSAGCGECRGTGYKGRKAIAEILVLSDELREMVVEKRPIRLIKELAWSRGTRSLRDAALALVRTGETTLDEVRRVTQHG